MLRWFTRLAGMRVSLGVRVWRRRQMRRSRAELCVGSARHRRSPQQRGDQRESRDESRDSPPNVHVGRMTEQRDQCRRERPRSLSAISRPSGRGLMPCASSNARSGIRTRTPVGERVLSTDVRVISTRRRREASMMPKLRERHGAHARDCATDPAVGAPSTSRSTLATSRPPTRISRPGRSRERATVLLLRSRAA